jgi:hypothetical protein
MLPSRGIDRRLRAHRLAAPARSPLEAAAHMLAVQSQDFAGGRWALAVRSHGAPSLADLDAAFDRGDLVRAWTMRGTLHTVPARDLAWMLAVTGERQARSAAGVHRREGIDAAEMGRLERLTRDALRGGGRLTRIELAAVWEAGGVATGGQRGYHLLGALALRGVVCLGPIVPRPGAVTREQFIVLCEEWIPSSGAPADPRAELAVRYLDGHGPATARDLAWWTGLPLGEARAAVAAASDRVRVIDDAAEPLLEVAAGPPRRSPRAEGVVALPPFDEYYLGYGDRLRVCTPDEAAAIGPGKNGMVRAVVADAGRVVGTWLPAAAARGADAFTPFAAAATPDPAAATPDPAAVTPDPAAVTAALARYAAFLHP